MERERTGGGEPSWGEEESLEKVEVDAASSCAPWPGDPGNTQQIKPSLGEWEDSSHCLTGI